MKLTEALKIIQQAPAGAEPFTVRLACGFTPLHLQTFLTAHLQAALPARRVQVTTGLYGDLAGTVEALTGADVQAAVIALEWPDLDARFGYRHTGGWGPAEAADAAASAERMLSRIQGAIERAPAGVKIAISLPTLPLPPVFYTPALEAGEMELRLRQAVLAFGACAARLANVTVASAQQIDERSPLANRFDLKSELLTGLPYTLPHADAVAAACAGLIQPKAPKKGLITDLDDTLWRGILGDAGVDAVAWDLESHSQVHGLYQQVLRALADQGVLIGIASKNDPDMVRQAFERDDIVLPADKIFPVEVHWSAKSGSVGRILKTWNIGADSVVFVDDSPMELAEVEQAHPGIECLLFPKDDYAAAHVFFRRLRDLFGKSRVTEEDAIRLESIRQGAALQEMAANGGSTPEAFLAEMKASITFDFDGAASDPRVLELVNKTNQFNLNGIRYTEPDWRRLLEQPGAFVASVAYEDKFGPLGKIAVIQGRCEGRVLRVGTWVMSCRAFARRIEHQCVQMLFDRFGAECIHFDFAPTTKNGPLRDFFSSLIEELPASDLRLDRKTFDGRRPALYHTVAYAKPKS